MSSIRNSKEFRWFRDRRTNGAHYAASTTSLGQERQHLIDLRQKAGPAFKGASVALKDVPEKSLGLVEAWDCKAVWLDVKLSTAYEGKKSGETHRFGLPSKVVLCEALQVR